MNPRDHPHKHYIARNYRVRWGAPEFLTHFSKYTLFLMWESLVAIWPRDPRDYVLKKRNDSSKTTPTTRLSVGGGIIRAAACPERSTECWQKIVLSCSFTSTGENVALNCMNIMLKNYYVDFAIGQSKTLVLELFEWPRYAKYPQHG